MITLFGSAPLAAKTLSFLSFQICQHMMALKTCQSFPRISQGSGKEMTNRMCAGLSCTTAVGLTSLPTGLWNGALPVTMQVVLPQMQSASRTDLKGAQVSCHISSGEWDPKWSSHLSKVEWDVALCLFCIFWVLRLSSSKVGLLLPTDTNSR